MRLARFGRRLGRPALAAALAALLLPSGAAAQPAFPTKTITVVVPAAAGGPTDAVARLLAESMGRTLGQTLVVENVGGAGGTIGMARVAGRPADGYTLAVWHIAQATAPALYDGLAYDVIADFTPIGRITDVPMTLVSRATLPARSVGELLDWIRAEKTNVTYGHAGIGSASHLCALMLMKELGVAMTGVGYRGTGPAMTDLLSAQFDVMCDQTTNTTNQIKDGKIKGYAVTARARLAPLPELPTLDGGALPGFEATAWHALWGPKGLPQPVVDRLVGALQAALTDPKVVERFASLGTEPVPAAQQTPAALAAHLTAEVARWGAVIKAAGVKGN